MPIKLLSSGGGEFTVTPAASASNRTVTLPDATTTLVGTDTTQTLTNKTITSGTVYPSGSPAFSAWANAATSVTNTGTVDIQFGTEEFDLTNAYDTATGKFTPQVAGYYQFNASVQMATSNYVQQSTFAKNGTSIKGFINFPAASLSTTGSALIYLNGSTDYVTVKGYSATTQNTATGQAVTYFQGVLVRAA